MQTTEASYLFKKIIRVYNGNKSLLIKNIPTRLLLGMIDADNYIGNWRKKYNNNNLCYFY